MEELDSSSRPRHPSPVRHGDRLALIVSLCRELANAGSLEQMFGAVLEVLADGVGFDRCSVLTLDGLGAMRFRAWRGLSAEYRQRFDGHSPWSSNAEDPQPILVDDVRTHPLTALCHEVFAQDRIGALVFLPLVAQRRLVGKFMVYAGEPTDWSKVDLSFAYAVADLLSSFLVRDEAQQRLLQARKMESLGFLAGGIAHDFNNLLTAMLGYADLLHGEVAHDSQAGRHAEQLLGIVGQATDLTRQLLGFARPKPLQVEVVDLVELVESSRGQLQQLLGDGIALRVVCSCAHAAVSANRAQMLQVVRNLINNARDAMPSGGSVTLGIARRSSGPAGNCDHVELAITDTGVGMSDAVRARIFEPLFTTKGHGRGTGLGLATCYGVVSYLGGEIAVTSTIGKGSSFVVTLPLAKDAPVAPPAAVAIPRPARRSTRQRVLLVEDQAQVRRAIEVGLQAHGFLVAVAGSGVEALAELRSIEAAGESVDAVVTDVVMPEMGGVELVDVLQRTAPHLPVLLITGYAEVAQDLPAHVPVLQKPFAPVDLARRLHEMLPDPIGIA